MEDRQAEEGGGMEDRLMEEEGGMEDRLMEEDAVEDRPTSGEEMVTSRVQGSFGSKEGGAQTSARLSLHIRSSYTHMRSHTQVTHTAVTHT